MEKIFAQVLGVLVAVICIVSAQFKHKWQMLLGSMLANLLNGLSFFFLGGALSAAILCWIAVFQTILFSYKAYHDKPITVFEKIIFLVAFAAVGIFNTKTFIDVLPAIGGILFVLGTFCKKEQHMRMVNVASNCVWISYEIIVVSTAIIAQVLSLSSNLIALYRYRKKPQKTTESEGEKT